MLDSNLIGNVVLGIAVYKGLIAIIEFSCIKFLSILLDRKITAKTRQERRRKAIDLCNEELRKTELN